MNNIKYIPLGKKIVLYNKIKTNNKLKKIDNIFEKINMNSSFYINYKKMLSNNNKSVPIMNLSNILLNKYEINSRIFLYILNEIKKCRIKIK